MPNSASTLQHCGFHDMKLLTSELFSVSLNAFCRSFNIISLSVLLVSVSAEMRQQSQQKKITMQQKKLEHDSLGQLHSLTQFLIFLAVVIFEIGHLQHLTSQLFSLALKYRLLFQVDCCCLVYYIRQLLPLVLYLFQLQKTT